MFNNLKENFLDPVSVLLHFDTTQRTAIISRRCWKVYTHYSGKSWISLNWNANIQHWRFMKGSVPSNFTHLIDAVVGYFSLVWVYNILVMLRCVDTEVAGTQLLGTDEECGEPGRDTVWWPLYAQHQLRCSGPGHWSPHTGHCSTADYCSRSAATMGL